MTTQAVPFASGRTVALLRKIMPEPRLTNIQALAIPVTMVATVVGVALMLQSRLLSVEHEVSRVREAIDRIERSQTERLRQFAIVLAELNPTLKVPEVR